MSYFRNVMMNWLNRTQDSTQDSLPAHAQDSLPAHAQDSLPAHAQDSTQGTFPKALPKDTHTQGAFPKALPKDTHTQDAQVQASQVQASQVQASQVQASQVQASQIYVWVVSLISCQERVMMPILATEQAQVGAYIRANIPKFLIFFRRLAECLETLPSEGDEIAQQLKYDPPESDSDEDLIISVGNILVNLSDDDIVREFYGYSLNGENSYKVCIEGPLSLLSVNT